MMGNAKAAAIHGFLRSFNLVLKSARLYKFEHERTASQFDAAWKDLTAAVAGAEGGFVLGVAGKQLLLDGQPLKGDPAEQSFAGLLGAAGLASIQFLPSVNREELAALVRAFAAGGPKSGSMVAQLQTALAQAGAGGIRVNEVRYVAEDAALAEAPPSAQMVAHALGGGPEVQAWLSDPQKLLQMIVAARGAESAGEGPGGAAGGPASETELADVFGVLGELNQAQQPGTNLDSAALAQKFAGLPQTAQRALERELTRLAEADPAAKLDKSRLLELAENLAIQFALERYQRGEVKIDAVRQVIDRMSRELDSLRKRVGPPGEKITAEAEADRLDREFWARVPAHGKRTVLLSPEAWCIPPRNLRQFVEELLGQGEAETAGAILENYVRCVQSTENEGRRKVLAGLAELVDLYVRPELYRLEAALRVLGEQLPRESDPHLETALHSVFVHYSQEAAERRLYPAVGATLAALGKPGVTAQRELHQRIGVEGRLADFIEHGVGAPHLPEGLVAVLQALPGQAAEQLALRFKRVTRRDERERLVELAVAVGRGVAEALRNVLRSHPPLEATAVVGLLSRLDAAALDELLPASLPKWKRIFQDQLVHQLAIAAAPERGRLLLKLLEGLDPLVVPAAIDEIGISGETTAVPILLRGAQGELPPNAKPYVRLKAIEALGRLRAREASEVLKPLVEAKRLWKWVNPPELRLVAAQVLERLDPGWGKNFLPKSGLVPAEVSVRPLELDPSSSWARPRRYRRYSLTKRVQAVARMARGKIKFSVKVLSLGGGLLAGGERLAPGTEALLEIHGRVRALVFFREAAMTDTPFEIVDIGLEDRGKLRALLSALPA